MNDSEKIEALREWLLAERQQNEGADDPWNYGYLVAIDKVLRFIDPPKPKWRQMVDLTARSIFTDVDPLADVLSALSVLAAGDADAVAVSLAHVVAMCEAQVGDGWQADPERVHPGFWGVAWLLVPLSHEPPDWAVVGHRSAAWLRSLTDGGAA